MGTNGIKLPQVNDEPKTQGSRSLEEMNSLSHSHPLPHSSSCNFQSSRAVPDDCEPRATPTCCGVSSSCPVFKYLVFSGSSVWEGLGRPHL